MKSHQLLKALIIVGGLAAVLTIVLRQQMQLEPTGGLAPGKSAPEIRAAGWLNGEGPTTASLDGKVYVVQGWFTTCIYCRKETPGLAKTYEKFHPRGVEFISLTFEDDSKMAAIEKFVSDTGMVWPTGYGARETLRDFDAEYFPCVWVVNQAGEIVWNRDSDTTLEEALEAALKEAPQA